MEHTVGYGLGLMAGILAGVGIVALLLRLRVLDRTFDERQELARGKAYRYGFWTLAAALAAYGLSELALGRWCDALAGGMLCLAPALTVFAVACIRSDAYLSLRERPKQILTVLALVAALNLVIGTVNLLEGRAVTGGVLRLEAVNLICAIMCLIVLGVLVHALRTRREEDA